MIWPESGLGRTDNENSSPSAALEKEKHQELEKVVGALTNTPIAMAPSMGLNAFFA